jgi:hypothetical protein
MSTANIQLIQSSVDAFNKSQGQLTAIAPFVHDPTPLKAASEHGPFSKMSCKITSISSHGDQVYFTYAATGTHTGDFLGNKSTNKTIEWEGGAIATISQGKIADIQVVEDDLVKLIKLGLLPVVFSMTGKWKTEVLRLEIAMTLTETGKEIRGTATVGGFHGTFPVTGSNHSPGAPNVVLQSKLGPAPKDLLTFAGKFNGANQVQGTWRLDSESGEAILNRIG